MKGWFMLRAVLPLVAGRAGRRAWRGFVAMPPRECEASRGHLVTMQPAPSVCLDTYATVALVEPVCAMPPWLAAAPGRRFAPGHTRRVMYGVT